VEEWLKATDAFANFNKALPFGFAPYHTGMLDLFGRVCLSSCGVRHSFATMTFNNLFRMVLVFLDGVCSDFEAWALILCKKLELLGCIFELGNDDLWWTVSFWDGRFRHAADARVFADFAFNHWARFSLYKLGQLFSILIERLPVALKKQKLLFGSSRFI